MRRFSDSNVIMITQESEACPKNRYSPTDGSRRSNSSNIIKL